MHRPWIIFAILCLFAQSSLSSPIVTDHNLSFTKSVPRFLQIESGTHGSKYRIDIYYPFSHTKQRLPVLLFVTGLNGLFEGRMYRDLFEELSARGIIVMVHMGPFRFAHQYSKRADEMSETLLWIENIYNENIQKEKTQYPIADLEKLVIGSHSAGGRAAIAFYREHFARTRGLIFIDPVDADPMNITAQSIQQNENFNHGTPVLILVSGLCQTPGVNQSWWPSCCPKNFSDLHYFEAFRGPKWYVKALDYGHADILNPVYSKFAKSFRLCKGSPENHPVDLLKMYFAGAMRSFISGTVEGQCDDLMTLTDHQRIPLRAETRKVGTCRDQEMKNF